MYEYIIILLRRIGPPVPMHHPPTRTQETRTCTRTRYKSSHVLLVPWSSMPARYLVQVHRKKCTYMYTYVHMYIVPRTSTTHYLYRNFCVLASAGRLQSLHHVYMYGVRGTYTQVYPARVRGTQVHTRTQYKYAVLRNCTMYLDVVVVHIYMYLGFVLARTHVCARPWIKIK